MSTRIYVYICLFRNVSANDPPMKDTQTFLKVLDPDDTSTGGGSASAIAGAMAGALLSMVCLISAKTQEGEDQASFVQVAAQAQELSEQLLQGSQADSLSFQSLREAFKLPRATEAERDLRSRAIQSAWTQAARVPLDNAETCLQLLRWISKLAERIKPQLRSDLNCAILLARAGLLGCLENVAANLSSIKDQDIASRLDSRSRDLRQGLALLEGSAGLPVPPLFPYEGKSS
jgi:methenyltetrahydrofolate cyclohydrolase